MTKNQKIYIAIASVVVILLFLSPFLMRKFGPQPVEDNNETIPENKMVTGRDVETFSGTISSVDTGCFVDAVCSVTIDGKKIILVKGGLAMDPNAPVGKLIGVNSIGDLQGKMGAYANVYAGLTPEGDYTLYGNTNYYVEVVKTSNK